MIDEADTFLMGRDRTRRSWETAMVNEFLTNIEAFRGMLVLSTNLKDTLDTAVFRRFPLKVEFRPLTDQGRRLLFQRYFPGSARDDWEARLGSLGPLTPGDFGTVRSRLDLIPGTDVFQALGEESHERGPTEGRKVGFHGL